MICKGHARMNGSQLAGYLADYLHAAKNEKVGVVEITGSAFSDLGRSLRAWEAEAQRSRCRKPLWHAQIAPAPGEFLTREQKIEAVNILERHLGFTGQPRAIVTHLKDGDEHIHVVWSRFNRTTGKAMRDDFSHRKNAAAAREMEERFGLQQVANPEFKSNDKSRTRKERREASKAAPTYQEFQRAKRSGLDPRERKAIINAIWQGSDSGHALRSGLQDAGYILARGKSRDWVVVDQAGDIHSLARQITEGKVAAVRQRLADVDPASIPLASHVQKQLRQAWCERQPDRGRAGHSPDAPKASPESAAPKIQKPPPMDRKSLDPADILAALTERQSTFTKADLTREIETRYEAHGHNPRKEDVEKLRSEVSRHDDFISLGVDRTERPRFTSREMLDTELAMRDASDALASRRGHEVDSHLRDAAPKSVTLGEEQRRAFEHVTGAADIAMVVGYAGTGKSTMLGAAREAWEAQGLRVRGTSLSSMAARGLQDGSAIKSRTLASALYALEIIGAQQQRIAELTARIDAIQPRGEARRKQIADLRTQRDKLEARLDETRLTKRDVVVVDEAAMVGSRDVNRLLQIAKEAGAKVVLVGDAEQLQAIDAGGAFRALRERHGAVEITEIRRQGADWQREATKNFAQSYTDEAMEAYRKRGHVHAASSHEEARSAMVAAWTKVRAAHPDKSQLMMAFTRQDVHELNLAARRSYRAEGRLKGCDVNISTSDGRKDFAEGDRLYFLKNDLRLGVMNGSLGSVEAISQHLNGNGHRMRVRLDDGKSVTFDTADYDSVSHGYAATIHKAQGATVDRAHVLASEFMDRHAAYVAMSRHREQVDMHFVEPEFRSFDGLVRTLARDRRKDTTLDYLERAEARGESRSFWEAVAKRVADPLARMKEIMDSYKTPEARSAYMRRRTAEQATEKLRNVLGKHKERRVSSAPGLTF